MLLAQNFVRTLTSLAAVSAMALAFSGAARADRLPLVGPGTAQTNSTVHDIGGLIVSVDPSSVPCDQKVTFGDVIGGETPGSSYDGLLWSGDMQFAERFMGQSLSFSGDFDVVSGIPIDGLVLQVGDPGQNLDVFAYTTNVLAGLGALGYPDLDAIGEGSIAMRFAVAQSTVSFDLVGGNGGSATLGFYRADGSLIDNVVVTGLAELTYGFATADASQSIAGILIQTTDPSGIGVVNICHSGGIVKVPAMTWGSLKSLYR
jgi:hypothetical protein